MTVIEAQQIIGDYYMNDAPIIAVLDTANLDATINLAETLLEEVGEDGCLLRGQLSVEALDAAEAACGVDETCGDES
jgi:hypothetical protein